MACSLLVGMEQQHVFQHELGMVGEHRLAFQLQGEKKSNFSFR